MNSSDSLAILFLTIDIPDKLKRILRSMSLWYENGEFSYAILDDERLTVYFDFEVYREIDNKYRKFNIRIVDYIGIKFYCELTSHSDYKRYEIIHSSHEVQLIHAYIIAAI